MRERAARLDRIAHMQTLMRQASEIRLAALRREEEALVEREEKIISALNAPHPNHGLFVNAMARHLALSNSRRQHVAEAIEKETERRLKADLSGRSAERLAAQLNQEINADVERKRLEECAPVSSKKPASDKQNRQ